VNYKENNAMDNFGFIRKHRKLNQIVTVFLTLLLVYQPFVYADQLALPSTDLVAPEGRHEPITSTSVEGQNLVVNAKVVDNVGVSKVTLFYRTIGTDSFSAVLMTANGTDSYNSTLKGELVAAPGIEYYIQAEDEAGNTRTFGYQFSPYIVKVTPSVRGQELNLEIAVPDNVPAEEIDSTLAAPAVVAAGAPAGVEEESIFSNTWFWVGIGILAAAAAGGGGGGDSGGGPPPSTGPGTTTVTISAPAP
jgi:hypothetical protein